MQTTHSSDTIFPWIKQENPENFITGRDMAHHFNSICPNTQPLPLPH